MPHSKIIHHHNPKPKCWLLQCMYHISPQNITIHLRTLKCFSMLPCKRKTNLMHNLFLVYFVNLYMFRAYLGPSSGGTTVCIQQLVLIIFLDDCVLSCLGWNSSPTRTTDTHLKRISTSCCIHRLYLLMMGLDTPETCRGWRNILRISCASSWSFFTW